MTNSQEPLEPRGNEGSNDDTGEHLEPNNEENDEPGDDRDQETVLQPQPVNHNIPFNQLPVGPRIALLGPNDGNSLFDALLRAALANVAPALLPIPQPIHNNIPLPCHEEPLTNRERILNAIQEAIDIASEFLLDENQLENGILLAPLLPILHQHQQQQEDKEDGEEDGREENGEEQRHPPVP